MHRRRVKATLLIGCFVLLGCALHQKNAKEEVLVPEQPSTNQGTHNPDEMLKRFEAFFELAPPPVLQEADNYPELAASQESREPSQPGTEPSALHSTPGSFQAIQIAPEEGELKQEVGLNFENADIHDVTKVVSEITEKSFIVDQAVQGTVTLYSEKALSPRQVFELFKSVLELNNLALIQIGDFYKIVKSADAQKRFVTVESDTLPAAEDRLVTQIVKLKYIRAREVKQILGAMTAAEIMSYPDDEGNTLIITDLASNVRKLLEVIKEMDVSQYANRYVEVFPIKHADLAELINDLNQILAIPGAAGPLEQMAAPPTPPMQPMQPTEPGVPPAEQPSPQQPVTPVVSPGTKTNLYPIIRLNALMVSTNNPEVITLVKKWIDILDQPSVTQVVAEVAPDVQSNHVYFVKYAKAAELAPILAQIYAEGVQPVQPEQPGEQPQQPQPQPAENQGQAPIFITEPTTNSIIIKATPGQYAQISSLLEKLDQRPLQVLIDVIIAEVALSDSDVFGVRGMLQSEGQVTIGEETNAVSATAQTNFPVAAGDLGFSYVINAPGRFLAQLRALATQSKVKVLSGPHILVQNNKSATINIGDSIPIKTTQGEGENQRTSVNYQATGIILTVTPQINMEGDVVMQIQQEVSTPGTAEAGEAPPINKTTATTFLVTQDGHPLVIGGLINTRDRKSVQGVPLLKDIPWLGKLFRYDETQSERKELLILVMPRIVRTPEQGWNLTDDVLSKQIRRLEQLFNREETDPEKIERFLKRTGNPQG